MAKYQNKGSKYEDQILEKIKYEFDDSFKYEKNYKIDGLISKGIVEFDIAIFRECESDPFWIIECKAWNKNTMKKLINEIRLTPTKVKELNKKPEMFTFIVQNKPNNSAINIAQYEKIGIEVISEQEADERKWFYEANEIFPYDSMFHPKIYQAKKEIEKDNYILAIDKLENIAYEEWLAIVDYSFDKYRVTIESLLRTVAEYHYDNGWRYNAIQKLDENGCLDEDFKEFLLQKESDLEIRELLLNL